MKRTISKRKKNCKHKMLFLRHCLVCSDCKEHLEVSKLMKGSCVME